MSSPELCHLVRPHDTDASPKLSCTTPSPTSLERHWAHPCHRYTPPCPSPHSPAASLCLDCLLILGLSSPKTIAGTTTKVNAPSVVVHSFFSLFIKSEFLSLLYSHSTFDYPPPFSCSVFPLSPASDNISTSEKRRLFQQSHNIVRGDRERRSLPTESIWTAPSHRSGTVFLSLSNSRYWMLPARARNP